MKKLALVLVMMVLVLGIVGCRRRVSEIQSIELVGVQLSPFYTMPVDNVRDQRSILTGDALLRATYSDKTETFNLLQEYKAGNVTVSGFFDEIYDGNTLTALALRTSVGGEFFIRISFEGVSLRLNFRVLDGEPYHVHQGIIDPAWANYLEEYDENHVIEIEPHELPATVSSLGSNVTIIVHPGVYELNEGSNRGLTFTNNNVTLISANATSNMDETDYNITVLDLMNNDQGLRFQADNIRVEGFKITNHRQYSIFGLDGFEHSSSPASNLSIVNNYITRQRDQAAGWNMTIFIQGLQTTGTIVIKDNIIEASTSRNNSGNDFNFSRTMHISGNPNATVIIEGNFFRFEADDWKVNYDRNVDYIYGLLERGLNISGNLQVTIEGNTFDAVIFDQNPALGDFKVLTGNNITESMLNDNTFIGDSYWDEGIIRSRQSND